MMNQKKIMQELRELLKKMNIFPGVDQLPLDENLFTAGALDSLTLIQYVLLIEDEFQIRLENEDITYDRFKSFSTIIQLLQEKYKL